MTTPLFQAERDAESLRKEVGCDFPDLSNSEII